MIRNHDQRDYHRPERIFIRCALFGRGPIALSFLYTGLKRRQIAPFPQLSVISAGDVCSEADLLRWPRRLSAIRL